MILKQKKVANGKLEKLKQDQLYVDISKNGSVITKAAISQKQFEDEMDRAKRLSSLIRDMIEENRTAYVGYKQITEAFKHLFSDATSDE